MKGIFTLKRRSSQRDEPKTSEVTTRLFHLLLECQLIENKLPTSFIYSLTTTHLLILAYSFCSVNRVKNLLDDMLFYPYDSMLLVACIGLAGLNLLLQAALTAGSIRGQSKPSLKFITVVGNCLCIYIAQPFLMMSFSRRISSHFFTGDNPSKASRLNASLSILGAVISTSYSCVLLSLKCSVPSRAVLSKINSLTETVFFLSTNICQLFCAFRDASVSRDTTLTIVFIFVSSFFLWIAIILLGWRRIYWNIEYNQFVLTACTRLFLLKTASEMFRERFAGIGLISFIILQGFLAKVMDTSTLLLLKIDIFDPELSEEKKYIGAVLMNEYLTQRSQREYRGIESDLCVYYTGLWFRYMSSGRLMSRSSHESISNKMMNPAANKDPQSNSFLLRRSNNFKLVHLLLTKVTRQPLYFKLMSLLQATEIMSYFRTSRDLNSMYSQINGSSILARYQAFQLQAIWECRLYALDIGKTKESKDAAISVLDNFSVVSLIMEGSDSWRDSSYVDTQRTFRSIDKFNRLAQEIENTMKNQLRIFDTLHQESTVTAATFRDMNKHTLESRKTVAELIRDLNIKEDVTALYSYFYPTIIMFYSMIQYDVEKSDLYVIHYKKKLGVLQASSSYKNENSSAGGKEIDSVAVKVAIEKESLGTILNVSFNSNQFLGQWRDSTVIGKSVNIMVPDSLAESHNKAMESYQTVAILNKERRVLINDFNGNLKQAELLIKLAPCIVEPVSAFCLMSFDIREKGPNIILDEDLNIIASDSSFRKVLLDSNLLASESSQNLFNVGQLSMKLYASIKLMRGISMYFKRHSKQPGGLQSNPSIPLPDKIMSLLGVVNEQNATNGMMYDIGKGSVLSTLFGQTQMHARFEFEMILGKSCIKAFISRKSRVKTTSSDGGKVNQNKSGENKKLDLPANQNILDHMSDDAATNKAVVEHNQVMAEYNSEQKESMVNKEKNIRAFDIESGDHTIHRLDDLIVPAIEGLNAALQKMNQRMRNPDPDAAHSGKDRSTNEDKVMLDFSPEMRDILILIDTQQKVVENETAAEGLDKILQRSDNFSSSIIENGPHLSKTTTYGFDKLLTSKLSGWQQPLIEKFKIVKIKRGFGDKKRILGEESKQNPGLTEEEARRKKDLRMQDPINWIKQNQMNTGGQLKTSLSLGTLDNSNHQPIPNIATHKTINRIFSLFTVVSAQLGQRNDRPLLQSRKQVCRFFGGHYFERIQKDGAQEIWCSVQQGFEDHQPERYSSLVLLFGCGSLHCF